MNDVKSFVDNILKTEKQVTVLFTKKDGTERKMICTLCPEKIPQELLPINKEIKRKKSNDALSVFDIEQNAWRSFRYDSLKEIHYGSKKEKICC